MPQLKPKHEIVALALADGKSFKDAYLLGGFSYDGKSAHRFCHRDDIQARVQELIAGKAMVERQANMNAAEALGISKRWVLERLKYAAERALRGHVLKPDKDGNPLFGPPNYVAANRSLELIGRELGMFIERHEVGGVGEFARYTDAELMQRARADAQALGIEGEALEVLMLTFQPKQETDGEAN